MRLQSSDSVKVGGQVMSRPVYCLESDPSHRLMRIRDVAKVATMADVAPLNTQTRAQFRALLKFYSQDTQILVGLFPVLSACAYSILSFKLVACHCSFLLVSSPLNASLGLNNALFFGLFCQLTFPLCISSPLEPVAVLFCLLGCLTIDSPPTCQVI